jgi:hypothetical protein
MLKQQGLSDAAAVKKLVEWEGNLRNPATRQQAFEALHQAYGYQPQQQQSPYAHMDAAQADAEIARFSQGRPHMGNQAVRNRMAWLMQAGHAHDLHSAYEMTIRGQ